MKIRKRQAIKRKAPTQIGNRSEHEHIPYRPYFVYGLVEPGGRIFYIGMTNDMNRRYQQHIAGDENRRKTGFIRKLGDRIEVKILDTTMNLERAQQLEAFWILYFTLDQEYLTNSHAGVWLDLMELDDEHTDQLAEMLQRRWGKEGAANWERQRWDAVAQGSWQHVKGYSKFADERA